MNDVLRTRLQRLLCQKRIAGTVSKFAFGSNWSTALVRVQIPTSLALLNVLGYVQWRVRLRPPTEVVPLSALISSDYCVPCSMHEVQTLRHSTVLESAAWRPISIHPE